MRNMKIKNIFHLGHHKVDHDEQPKRNSERHESSPVAPDWMYQGSWCGGDGHTPPHDKKEYAHDYGYFSKKTEVADDKAYQH
jgi:hypothetical protein